MSSKVKGRLAPVATVGCAPSETARAQETIRVFQGMALSVCECANSRRTRLRATAVGAPLQVVVPSAQLGMIAHSHMPFRSSPPLAPANHSP